MPVTINGTTGIATPDGSASVPPYTGSSGATNGLYFPSATSMALASNGSVALTIDSSQNVGIGTASPSQKLNINSSASTCVRLETTSATSQTYFNAVSSSGTSTQLTTIGPSQASYGIITAGMSTVYSNSNVGLAIGTDGAGPVMFYTNSAASERMRIDNNGIVNVGALGASGSIYDNNGGTDYGTVYRLQSAYSATSGRVAMGNNNNAGIGLYSTTCYNSAGNQIIVSLVKGEADSTTAGSETGFLSFHTKPSGAVAYNSERARITNAGYLLVNRTGNSNYPAYISSRNNGSNVGAVYAETSSNNYFGLGTLANTTSYADFLHLSECTRSQTTAYYFLYCRSSSTTTPDTEFALRGDGNAYADGTWNNNGADYAEYFESATGAALTVGASVVLDGSKVREATDQDLVSDVIGVVRPKEPSKASMVVGNTAWNKWANRYITDDFDRYIMEDHDVVEWRDDENELHSYESHAIPSGVIVPENATIKTHDDKGNKFQHYKVNPDYDADIEYIPRENRDEWVIIGLVGQVKILKGQPVNDRWVKMRDVSPTVEEWMIR